MSDRRIVFAIMCDDDDPAKVVAERLRGRILEDLAIEFGIESIRTLETT
jgi:hypothetical protein